MITDMQVSLHFSFFSSFFFLLEKHIPPQKKIEQVTNTEKRKAERERRPKDVWNDQQTSRKWVLRVQRCWWGEMFLGRPSVSASEETTHAPKTNYDMYINTAALTLFYQLHPCQAFHLVSILSCVFLFCFSFSFFVCVFVCFCVTFFVFT